MMEPITKYELVVTLEFQLVTDPSLPDWIVRLDLYKTIRNKEVLYYPRIFRRESYIIPRHGKRSVSHWLWTEESFRDLCWERNDLYGIYEEVIAEMGFPVLSTRLPDSKKFRRDLSEERKSVFRSTIFPMDTALLKGSGIREFSEEISDIIRPQ